MDMQMTLCRQFTTPFLAACLLVPLSAQSTQQAAVGDASVLSFARTASVRVLTFRQGDREGFAGARAVFTNAAWAQFVKDMEGWLDRNGAPTFTSSFVPSGDGRVV